MFEFEFAGMHDTRVLRVVVLLLIFIYFCFPLWVFADELGICYYYFLFQFFLLLLAFWMIDAVL